MNVCVCVFVRVRDAHTCSVAQSCPTLQAHGLYVATQAPLSMGFPRQEYRSRLPFLLKGIFPTSNQTCASGNSCTGKWILYH